MSLWDRLTSVRLRGCVTMSRRALFLSLSLSLSHHCFNVPSLSRSSHTYAPTTVYDKTAGGERVERWQAAEKREKLD